VVLRCKSRAASKDYVAAEVRIGIEGDNGEGARRTLLGRALYFQALPSRRDATRPRATRKGRMREGTMNGMGDGDGGLR